MPVENAGDTVGKEFLIQRIRNEVFVEECNLSVNIYKLRKAFKNFENTENLIQTIPRRSFRFNAEVVKEEISSSNGKEKFQLY